jgi:hypothetical protein|tara:strand:+ start:4460 stop:4837 length:378 start_codon:yes stop_codon:yes gene_type:complete
MATYAQINSAMQSQGGAQLRTFDKSVGYYINAYVNGTGVGSYTRGQWYYQRYEYVNAGNSVYNNYIDNGIYTGNIIRQQDVIDSITSVVRRTVDLIEGRIDNRTINAYYCHASCHSSCHSSRGRR